MLRTGHLRPAFWGLALGALSATALAAPVTYQIDSAHTYPSFEADHGGVSYWRGKFNGTTGTIMYDKDAQSGTVDVTIDMSTIDFGHDGLNTHAKSADMFNVEEYPTATFTGKLAKFMNGAPTAVEGELTMHGVTKPVNLQILKFVCQPARMGGGETCGGDAYAEINRADFGVNFGEQFGMAMDVVLRIQVEAGSRAAQ
jgi:polyisoprenoid-binding protein YceI